MLVRRKAQKKELTRKRRFRSQTISVVQGQTKNQVKLEERNHARMADDSLISL